MLDSISNVNKLEQQKNDLIAHNNDIKEKTNSIYEQNLAEVISDVSTNQNNASLNNFAEEETTILDSIVKGLLISGGLFLLTKKIKTSSIGKYINNRFNKSNNLTGLNNPNKRSFTSMTPKISKTKIGLLSGLAGVGIYETYNLVNKDSTIGIKNCPTTESIQNMINMPGFKSSQINGVEILSVPLGDEEDLSVSQIAEKFNIPEHYVEEYRNINYKYASDENKTDIDKSSKINNNENKPKYNIKKIGYIIKKGDNLQDIADKFGVPQVEILRVNQNVPIKEGTLLEIPGLVYTVREAEYPYLLSREFGLEPKLSMDINGYKEGDHFLVGQEYLLPGAKIRNIKDEILDIFPEDMQKRFKRYKTINRTNTEFKKYKANGLLCDSKQRLEYCHPECIATLVDMCKIAEEKNKTLDKNKQYKVVVVSSLRTKEEQIKLQQKYKNQPGRVASPDQSPHPKGIAVDFYIYIGDKAILDPPNWAEKAIKDHKMRYGKYFSFVEKWHFDAKNLNADV